MEILRSRLIAPTPEEFCFLVFAVTYLCNSQCVMCNIWRKYKNHSGQWNDELTMTEIRDVFTRSRLLRRLRIIVVAGGEPFLRKDLREMVLFFYEINPAVSVIIPTNGQSPDVIGTTLEAISDAMTARGIRRSSLAIGVSLDGMEETHDRMRGLKGAFHRVLETAERLRRIEGLHWGFQFTFTPDNYRDFEAVHELSRRMEVGLGFQFAQESGHYYGNKEQRFGWTEAQRAEIRELLARKGYFLTCLTGLYDDSVPSDALACSDNVFFLDYVLGYLKDRKRTFDCFSGTHSCFLDPYGNVYPCISLERRYGNIRTEAFDALWRSPSADETRRSISRRECQCCSFCDIPLSLQRSWRPVLRNLKNIVRSPLSHSHR